MFVDSRTYINADGIEADGGKRMVDFYISMLYNTGDDQRKEGNMMYNRFACTALALMFILTLVGCNQRIGNTPTDSTATESAEPSAESTVSQEEEPPTNDQSSDDPGELVTDDELAEIFGDIPKKYQNYDKYLVAQPKADVITTYIAISPDGGYKMIETPLPDAMLTVYDFLLPIFDDYDVPEIDRIVYDEEQSRICVNFISKINEDEEELVLRSIEKTIMENQSGEYDGVYFEVNMQKYEIKL